LTDVIRYANREGNYGLYKTAVNTWGMVVERSQLESDELVLLKQQAAETEALNRAKQNQLEIAREIEQVENSIFELTAGKKTLEIKQFRDRGGDAGRFGQLKDLEEYLREGKKAADDYAETIKQLDREIGTHGLNQYDTLLYDAMERRASASEIQGLLDRTNRLEEMRRTDNMRPTDTGWNYTEGRFLSGRTSAASDYAAETARNTSAQTRLLERVANYLEQIAATKVSNDLNIESVNENWG